MASKYWLISRVEVHPSFLGKVIEPCLYVTLNSFQGLCEMLKQVQHDSSR